LRGPDEVVHRVTGIETNDRTYCGQYVADLFARHLRPGRLTTDPVSCMLCLDSENHLENEPLGHVMVLDDVGIEWDSEDDDDGT